MLFLFSTLWCYQTLLGNQYWPYILSHEVGRRYVMLLCQFLVLWQFDQIPVHGLPLWSFMFTLMGYNLLNRTPLDKWPARCRTSAWQHISHKRRTSLPLVGIKPAIKWLQIHALDCAVTTVSNSFNYITNSCRISL